MLKYAVRRILSALPTIFIVVTAVFLILRILPGDPALAVLGENASQEALDRIREQMGLNDPLWLQYVKFLGDLLRGDLGNSLMSGLPVTHLIVSVFPYTFQLAIAAITVAIIIGIPLGILAALKQGTWVDGLVRVLAILSISSPPFFLGILLLIQFTSNWQWFPSVGVGEGFLDVLHHLALPALTLGIIMGGVIMRFTRASMLEQMNQDYVRTARAKGVSEAKVVMKHIMRNSLIPVVTIIGLDITSLISGSVLIETIYSRPGLGSLAVDAIFRRDFNILQATMVLFTVLVVTVNLLVDISYSYINPRIRPR